MNGLSVCNRIKAQPCRAHDIMCTAAIHTDWPCSWHCRHRMPDTKYWHIQLCFHDLQTLIFNRPQIHWKTAMTLFSSAIPNYILFKNRNAYFLWFYFGHQALHGSVFQLGKARPHAACLTTQFLANNNVQLLPWLSRSPDLNPIPIWTDVFKVKWTPSKCAWVVPGTPAAVGGHPRASDLQLDPVHAREMLGSYWFSRTHPLLIGTSLSRKIPSDWTVSWTSHELWLESTAKMKSNELDLLSLNFWKLN